MNHLRISLVSIFYLTLGYWFLLRHSFHHITRYYQPLGFRPLVLFMLLYLGFIILAITDITKTPRRTWFGVRLTVVIATIVIFVGAFAGTQIALRHNFDAYDLIHDGAQLTEVAGEFLLAGQNPYAVNYKDTIFGEYNGYMHEPGHDNPAWYYYIYLPFYLVSDTAAQALGQLLGGWYDGRFPLLAAFVISLILLYQIIPRRELKLLGMIIFAFNPLFISFVIMGYNDIFVFAWLLLSVWLLQRGRVRLSAAALGLALASKQLAWLFAPFFLWYLWLKTPGVSGKQRLAAVWRQSWPMAATFLVFMLPFFLWGPGDFIQDVIGFPAGRTEHVFPVYGDGLSQILLQAGVIADKFDRYPFWIFQAVIGLPLLFWLLRRQKQHNDVSTALAHYGIFLFVFLLVSRFFNDNYLGFISLVFIAAWAFADQENDQATKS